VIGASEAVEQVFQNKLGTALAILTEERQRVNTRETVRGPHRDKEQRERLREIATLQIALTVLKRPMDNSEEGPEEQAGARDRVRTKMQSWVVTRSLDMIAPEVINSVVSHLFPVSSMELFTQLVKKWMTGRCRKWMIWSKHRRERITLKSGLNKDGPFWRRNTDSVCSRANRNRTCRR
jgi:hypothetical protein